MLKGRLCRSCAACLQILLDHRVTSLAALLSAEPIFQTTRLLNHGSVDKDCPTPDYFSCHWKCPEVVRIHYGSPKHQKSAHGKHPEIISQDAPLVGAPASRTTQSFPKGILPPVAGSDAATPPADQGGQVPQLSQVGRNAGDFLKNRAEGHRFHA